MECTKILIITVVILLISCFVPFNCFNHPSTIIRPTNNRLVILWPPRHDYHQSATYRLVNRHSEISERSSAITQRSKYTCMKTLKLSSGETKVVKAPWYAYFLENGCHLTIRGLPDHELHVICTDVNIPTSPKCETRYLALKSGQTRKKYCGKKAVQYSGEEGLDVFLTYKTDRLNIRPFRCRISAIKTVKSYAIETTSYTGNQPSDESAYSSSSVDTKNCVCGIPGTPTTDRIVGGTIADKGKYIWIVAIKFPGHDLPFCGGSLINDRFVVTAAHCIHLTGMDTNSGVAIIVLNEHDTSTDDETITVSREIKRAFFHNKYNPTTGDYDIGLIELKSKVRIKEYDPYLENEPQLTPICLPSANQTDGTEPGDPVTVSGWGLTSEGGSQPNVLMKVDVNVISQDVCNEQYNDGITPRMLCAGKLEGGKDSCQGDSGGPLMYHLHPSDRYLLAGLVSIGEGCARPGKSGIYCRLSDPEIRNWLTENTADAEYCVEYS